MDYTDNFNKFFQIIFIPIKLILPIAPVDLFRTLGVGMLGLLLLPYKKNKNLLFLVIFFVISFAILQNYQSRWLLPLLIFVGIFIQDVGKKWFKKITYLQFIAILIVIVPLGFSVLIQNFFPHLNMNDKIVPIKKITETINLKYKNQKYFSNLNYFYYQDNKIPIYYSEINKFFDKDFFNRNVEVKYFLFQGSPDNFSMYINEGKFDFKDINNYKKSNRKNNKPTCLNSEYELIDSWNFNARRFFIFPAIKKLYLFKLC